MVDEQENSYTATALSIPIGPDITQDVPIGFCTLIWGLCFISGWGPQLCLSCVSEVLVLGPISAGLTYWTVFWDYSQTCGIGNLVSSPVSSLSAFIHAWVAWMGPDLSIIHPGTTEGGCAYHCPGPVWVLWPYGEVIDCSGATVSFQLNPPERAATASSSQEHWQQVQNKCMSLQLGRGGGRYSYSCKCDLFIQTKI